MVHRRLQATPRRLQAVPRPLQAVPVRSRRDARVFERFRERLGTEFDHCSLHHVDPHAIPALSTASSVVHVVSRHAWSVSTSVRLASASSVSHIHRSLHEFFTAAAALLNPPEPPSERRSSSSTKTRSIRRRRSCRRCRPRRIGRELAHTSGRPPAVVSAAPS